MSITLDDFWSILHNMPTPKEVFFRLYYNDDGSPECYSMEDLPGKYITIDAETFFQGAKNIKVVDGKIIEIVPPVTIKKLKPGPVGVPCDMTNISVVVDELQPHKKWSKKTNEIN